LFQAVEYYHRFVNCRDFVFPLLLELAQSLDFALAVAGLLLVEFGTLASEGSREKPFGGTDGEALIVTAG
jgi:hypothetical protein